MFGVQKAVSNNESFPGRSALFREYNFFDVQFVM